MRNSVRVASKVKGNLFVTLNFYAGSISNITKQRNCGRRIICYSLDSRCQRLILRIAYLGLRPLIRHGG